jgi:hypothetical protein
MFGSKRKQKVGLEDVAVLGGCPYWDFLLDNPPISIVGHSGQGVNYAMGVLVECPVHKNRMCTTDFRALLRMDDHVLEAVGLTFNRHGALAGNHMIFDRDLVRYLRVR